MKRIQTVEDFTRSENYLLNKRCKPGVLDPLEDPNIPLLEKQRLAQLWEVVQVNRQNQARLTDLLGPLLISKAQPAGAPQPERTALPLSSGLQLACLYGDLNFVKMLVSRGENIDQVTMSPDNFGRGRCPLSVAAEQGHNNILEFLIQAGADVRNIHDPPLRQAVRRNDLIAVTALVKAGADPDPTLHQLLTPNCNVGLVRLLLEAGATPSATLVLTAVWRGCDVSVVQLLLEFGAPCRSDLENESALEVAICRGADKRIVEALVRATPRWTMRTHHMHTRGFRERVMQMLLINNRAPANLKLPTAVLQKLVWWLSVAEKRSGDRIDLLRSLCNSYDTSVLERRIHELGLSSLITPSIPSYMSGSGEHYGHVPSVQRGMMRKSSSMLFLLDSPSASSPEKYSLLQNMNTRQLLSILWHEDRVVAPPVSVVNSYPGIVLHDSDHTNGKSGIHHSSSGSDSTHTGNDDEQNMDEGDDEDDEANNDMDEDENGIPGSFKSLPKPARQVRPQQVKQRPLLPPSVFLSVEAEALLGTGFGAQRARNTAHPVADTRNPNGPKPHHCTCCHVCHVSMKQRPRPIAACSQCNTIICKLCLQDRWKSDQWEEACASAGWVCHKCNGTCVCKACKSKGIRGEKEKILIK